MVRGSTPDYLFRVQADVDLEEALEIWVTFCQGTKKITKTGADVVPADNTVSCYLTEEESLSLSDRMDMQAQVNWTYMAPGGIRRASTVVAVVPVTQQLYPEAVIT